MAETRYCYEKAFRGSSEVAGRMDLAFVVSPEGRVARAEVVASSLKNPAVEDCVIGRLRGWAFPRPEDGKEVSVTWPVVFKPAPAAEPGESDRAPEKPEAPKMPKAPAAPETIEAVAPSDSKGKVPSGAIPFAGASMPSIRVTDHGIEIHRPHRTAAWKSLPKKGDEHDLAALTAALVELAESLPGEIRIVVTLADDRSVELLYRVLDASREHCADAARTRCKDLFAAPILSIGI
jgi:TonB family protein